MIKGFLSKYNPLFLFLFLFPLSERLSTIALIGTLFLVFTNIKSIDSNKLFLYSPLVVLYVFYGCLEFINSDIIFNSNVEQKASFILFPLLFLTVKLDKTTVVKTLNFFVIGNVTAIILIFIRTIITAGKEVLSDDIVSNDFFVKSLYWKLNLDPIYQSLLFLLAITYVLFYKSFNKKTSIVLCLFLSIGIYFCQSVFGLASLLVILLYFLFINKIKIAVPLIIVCFISIILNYEIIFESRLVLWEASFDLIMDNFFLGYGSVNAQLFLDSKLYYIFFNTSETLLLKLGLNSHNQYLQLVLEGGIFLFLIFAFLVFVYVKKSFNTSNSFFILSCLLLLIVMFIECIFERYVGVAAFSLFYCLTINEYFENKKYNNY